MGSIQSGDPWAGRRSKPNTRKLRFGLVGHPEQYTVRHANGHSRCRRVPSGPSQAPLELPWEVPRLGCHDCKGWPTLSDSSFAVWRAQQLSSAERKPAAWEETQDEGLAAVQLLGGVEMAVSVWQEEI